MEANWAANHIQVIRTLMERSAIYRRALAPVMLMVGAFGMAAAAFGWFLSIEKNPAFSAYWVTISLAAISGAYLMVRRQAIRAREAFWSPPTRRVTQALLPPLVVGAIVTLRFLSSPTRIEVAWLLPPLWMALYGTAIHAAGFFMPRGMKLFGWTFILAGCASGAVLVTCRELPALKQAHVLMGAGFGVLHMAYGVYLYFTEPRKNEA